MSQDADGMHAAQDAVGVAEPELKPLLRGWFHALMTPVALVAGIVLIVLAPGVGLKVAAGVYTFTAVLMFGNSATYHRFYSREFWGDEVRQVFRRLDHSFIFIFIAGTYTPLSVALLHGRDRITLLTAIWIVGLFGCLSRIFWMHAPRLLYTALYIVMGWAAVWWMPQLYAAGGPAVIAWLAAGGVVYTLGALAYGFKRPNPWPRVFGFHEIFHLATVIAAVCHYVSLLLAVGAGR